MSHPIKNIEFEKAVQLVDMVQIAQGQVVSRTLSQGKGVSITLFAFDSGEEIATHASHGDALVQMLEGTANITIGNTVHAVQGGQSIVMPANIPHALLAVEPFKMLLTVVFPLE